MAGGSTYVAKLGGPPDPTADDGVHASFVFGGGRTLVGHRDGWWTDTRTDAG
jgi:hypothetical protein